MNLGLNNDDIAIEFKLCLMLYVYVFHFTFESIYETIVAIFDLRNIIKDGKMI